MLQQDLTILILAAGSASRMGTPKQLLPWKNDTLLGHAIHQATQISENVVVVLGSYAEAIQEKLPTGVETVINTEWQKGMGHSIAVGVSAITKTRLPKAIMITLIDQPLVDSAYLQKLWDAFKKNPSHIIATDYEGRAGVPAIFPNSMFHELENLQHDRGAKQFMNDNHELLILIAPEGKNVDIDHPKIYRELFDQYGRV